MPKVVKIDVDAAITTAYEILQEAPDRADSRVLSAKFLEAQTYTLLVIAESLRTIAQRGRGAF